MLQLIWRLHPDVRATFQLINRTRTVRLADEIDEGELRAAVIAALQAEPQRDVLVQADRRVEYEHVLSAMVLLQTAGAARLGFLSDPLDGPVARP